MAMDPNRQETIDTILELAQSIEPRLKGMHPTELKAAIKETHRVDLDEDDEDKLDALMGRLAHRKKTMPVHNSRVMGPVAPVRSTPSPITRDVAALTDFRIGDRVRHVNCPDWGEGDIVSVEPFHVAPEVRQKLQILFNRVGRKTIIVVPGMLEHTLNDTTGRTSRSLPNHHRSS